MGKFYQRVKAVHRLKQFRQEHSACLCRPPWPWVDVPKAEFVDVFLAYYPEHADDRHILLMVYPSLPSFWLYQPLWQLTVRLLA
jgi:hypothetical protein